MRRPRHVVAGGTDVRATLKIEGVAPLHATRPSQRKTAVVLFTLFCILGLTLTFIGIFFRGPGYSFVIPYLPFFQNSTNGFHFAL